jgi:hypothetical protein
MALTLKSGSGTDELDILATKAAKVTLYDLLGNAVNMDRRDVATYAAFCNIFTPPATPTDVMTLHGSDTKTVRVLRAHLYSVQTTAGVNAWYLNRRSTAQTGGAVTGATAVPMESDDEAASAVAEWWTTLFTGGGSLIGNIWAGRVTSPAPATAGIGQLGITIDFVYQFGKPIILHGAGESLNWNFNGAALPSGLAVLAGFVWTEE